MNRSPHAQTPPAPKPQRINKAFAAGLLAVACSAALSGCDVMYLSQHDIGRQQCDKLVDFDARKACLAKLPPADYNAYEKQREKLSEGSSEKALPPPKPKAGCFKREATGETVCAN